MAITAESVQSAVAEMRMPALSIYGGDWMRDAVAACSLGAQGLWFRMMLAMHDAKPYGHLVGSNGQPLGEAAAARLCGCATLAEFRKYLAELDAVGVPGRTGDGAYADIFKADIGGEAIDLSPLRLNIDGVLYCRRMVRDQRLRVIRKLAGKRGGNRNLVNQISAPLDNQMPDTCARPPAENENDLASPVQPTKSPEGVQGEPSPAPSTIDIVAAAARLMHKIEHCGFHDRGLPTPQIVTAWVTEYGEELVAETVHDPRLNLAGKRWQYLDSILQDRKENPNERPGNRRRADGRRAAQDAGPSESDRAAELRRKFPQSLTLDDVLRAAK